MLQANSSRLCAAILLVVVVWTWARWPGKTTPPTLAPASPTAVQPDITPGPLPDE